MFRALVATVVLIACGGDSSSGPTNPTGARVAQISITPSGPTLSVGSQLAMQAEVRDASGNRITGTTVFWSSADTSIVAVSSTGVLTGKSIGSAQIAASAGGQSARTVVSVVSIPVASVAMVPSAATLVIDGSTTLRSVAYDAAGHELSGRSFVWASSAERVVTVDDTGLVTGVSAGTATVTATSEGKTASSTITITLIPVAAIAVTPGSAALLVGQSASLTAVATDANGNVLSGRPMTWTSVDSTIASVSELGLVTAVAPGAVNISATAEGTTATAEVVVTAATPPPPTPVASVVVNPGTASIVLGGKATLSATIRDANGATLSGRTVTWASSAPQTATVNGSGVVTAVAIGRAVVTATSEGKSDSSIVTISAIPVASISVTPTTANMLVGDSTTISATTKDAAGNVLSGRVITWTSTVPSIAKVSATGKVTALLPGDVTITATSEGKSANVTINVKSVPVASVTITPSTETLRQGDTTTFVATPKDESGGSLDGRVASWISTPTSVATIVKSGAASGLVTAKRGGTATVFATIEGTSNSATVTVIDTVASVSVNAVPPSIAKYATTTLSASVSDDQGNPLPGRPVSWLSLQPSVATVDRVSGLVTAKTEGSATITATREGKADSASITVTRAPVATVTVDQSSTSLQVGADTTFTVTLKDEKGLPLSGRTITWSSNAPDKARVDSTTGLVTAVDSGTAVITATSETKTGTASVSVTLVPVASIELSPLNPSLVIGDTTQLTAVTKDANGNTLSDRTVSWTFDPTGIVTVNPSTGLVTAVTGVAAGTANITASSGSKSTTTTVTVTAPIVPVATVDVAPPTSSISLSLAETATLIATPRDADGNALSGGSTTWSSDTPLIATVDQSSVVVTPVSVGTATIKATVGGIAGTATVTVNP